MKRRLGIIGFFVFLCVVCVFTHSHTLCSPEDVEKKDCIWPPAIDPNPSKLKYEEEAVPLDLREANDEEMIIRERQCLPDTIRLQGFPLPDDSRGETNCQ